jgi:hypothetical protein
MFPASSPRQTDAILGAMAQVAAAPSGGPIATADRTSIAACAQFLFRRPEAPEIDALPRSTPSDLRNAVGTGALGEYALRCLTVMAFVDGVLDAGKIDAVLGYAAALGIDTDYLNEIAASAKGKLQWALADMVRANMESITGAHWADGDALAWLLPYRDGQADQALEARFEALGELPKESFGRAFCDFYKSNGYLFPGNPQALNEHFAVSHDSTHVLAGYTTDPRGELLTSTFTAAMHDDHPMSGHILPVIYSWHLGIKINDVAQSAQGALDPAAFWHAWERGGKTRIDLFGRDWDFWTWAPRPIAALRAEYIDPA